jgi:hypothetical protein
MTIAHRVQSIVATKGWILLMGLIVAATIHQSASAAIRTFSIDPYGTQIDGGTKSIGSYGAGDIILPSSAHSAFSYGFVIPDDYRANSPIRIVLSWHTPVTGCDFSLLPNFSWIGPAQTTPQQLGMPPEVLIQRTVLLS